MALLPSDKYSVRFAAFFLTIMFLLILPASPVFVRFWITGLAIVGDLMDTPKGGVCTTADRLEELQRVDVGGTYVH